MICPKCRGKHPAKSGMTCGGCSYHFIFNPKETRSLHLTDGKFLHAISKAGQNGTMFFTRNQLYAAYAKIATTSAKGYLIFGSVLLLLSAIVAFTAFFPFAFVLGFGGVALVLGGLFGRPKPMTRQLFDQAISRWQNADRPIEGLIEKPSLNVPPKEWEELDIYRYGVERILVVERDLLVDLMVKNNQHSEQRMLVIAESGYPEYLMPRVAQLLNERSDLPVFLLHDSSSAGEKMQQRIRRLSWLPVREHPLVDIGFFQADFAKLKRADHVRRGYRGDALPADALVLGAMTLALGACFTNQTAIADEIAREASNTMNSGSSFG